MDVRKNAATLSDGEWERFLRAVISLKHTFPAGSDVSIYDQFVLVHWGVTKLLGDQLNPETGEASDGAHVGPAFLAWHREYLKRFEQALQSVDTQVTIPYWNWGLGGDWQAPETTELFRDDRMGPMGSDVGEGFPGDVTTGYFALAPNELNPLGWPVRFRRADPGGALKRRQSLEPAQPLPGEAVRWPTEEKIRSLLSFDSFHDFRPSLEGRKAGWFTHGTIHIQIGGDMRTMGSPNDPIFFLHHAQVDRIWAKWQQGDPADPNLAGHPGSASYNPEEKGPPGHLLEDWMWPWDGGASATDEDIAVDLPRYPVTDRVAPINVLDHQALGYSYDDDPPRP